MIGKTKPQDAADRRRMDWLSNMSCLPCMLQGWPGVPATIQHVTDGGRRHKDQHQHTYPSCPYHHQGIPPTGYSNGKILEVLYGPSFALDKREFAREFGTEEELVQIADALIRIQERDMARDGRYVTQREMQCLARDLHREIVLKRRNDALDNI